MPTPATATPAPTTTVSPLATVTVAVTVELVKIVGIQVVEVIGIGKAEVEAFITTVVKGIRPDAFAGFPVAEELKGMEVEVEILDEETLVVEEIGFEGVDIKCK
jgi:hypothetical protein